MPNFIEKIGCFVRAVAVAPLTLLCACGELENDIPTGDLDSERPLGISWNNFDLAAVESENRRRPECERLVEKLNFIIPAEFAAAAVSRCLNSVFSDARLRPDKMPTWSRRGGVSVKLLGDAAPAEIAYHYLHRVYPDDPISVRARRLFHAFQLHRRLSEIHKKSKAAGRYDENLANPYVIDTQKRGPCRFWIEGRVAISLCYERVIFIDGVEMALIFTHLDRVPFGRRLECDIEGTVILNCAEPDSSLDVSRPFEPNYYGALNKIAAWTALSNFAKCKNDDLAPIDSIWNLSANEQSIADPIIDGLKGDALAQYVFENADDLGGEASEEQRRKILMYLLRVAASQGSAAAMNEIGASLLYCYQGVQQNLDLAQFWLTKAVVLSDVYAMKSLALIQLLGLSDAEDDISAAQTLLDQCVRLDNDYCSAERDALTVILTAFNDET